MGVPARRGNPGSVTGAGGETFVSPRHPRDRDLAPSTAAQDSGVLLRRRQRRLYGRRVPGTADDRNAAATPPQGRADRLPHVRLAARFTEYFFRLAARTDLSPQLGHRLD
jgi:hypothetical protein